MAARSSMRFLSSCSNRSGQFSPDRVKLESDQLQQGEHKRGKVVFTDEYSHRQAEHSAHKQGQQRAVERTPDLGQHAIPACVGVPRGTRDEAPSVLAHCRQRLGRYGVDDVEHQEDGQPGEQVGSRPEDDVAVLLYGRRRACDGCFTDQGC